MEHDRLYADNQLTRERIAELLDTNRTYITQIMKDHSWQNLSQFVNSYRINEAVRLLSDKSKTECTMKEICTDIGFTSMSAFFRMFKTVIGMSPASYRKYMQDIDDNK